MVHTRSPASAYSNNDTAIRPEQRKHERMKCDTSDLKFSSGNVYREARELSSFRRYKKKKTPLEVHRYDDDVLKTGQTNSIDTLEDYAAREEGGIQEPKIC
jgi:hypothetical protein